MRGTLNDQPVEGLRDADDLLAPILEVMVLRDYIWVPWSQITRTGSRGAHASPRSIVDAEPELF